MSAAKSSAACSDGGLKHMSRVGKYPVPVPSGVTLALAGRTLTAKGKLGELKLDLTDDVDVEIKANEVAVSPRRTDRRARTMWGTTRSLINSMVTGVSKGFERKLQLVGVGYRAQAAGRALNLTLGFSHPVSFPVPEGVTIETPTQTEIVIRGADRQQVGQVAAVIRRYRPPEPYKGKGVRYSDEVVVRKEAKKK